MLFLAFAIERFNPDSRRNQSNTVGHDDSTFGLAIQVNVDSKNQTVSPDVLPFLVLRQRRKSITAFFIFVLAAVIWLLDRIFVLTLFITQRVFVIIVLTIGIFTPFQFLLGKVQVVIPGLFRRTIPTRVEGLLVGVASAKLIILVGASQWAFFHFVFDTFGIIQQLTALFTSNPVRHSHRADGATSFFIQIEQETKVIQGLCIRTYFIIV
ncbi:hypothetical protein AB994_4071 (plasmid) [Acinetobacter baumannii]|nr:hypothetical protein AB994_4071 [Acinetobacter baumannii]